MKRLICVLAFALLVVFSCAPATAAPGVPLLASEMKSDVFREARFIWGMDAPTATFAAQIHAESAWKPGAVSPVGARGLAQVMPGTETDLQARYPALADAGALNPRWAIRALITYDRQIHKRVSGTDACECMGKTLAGYNSGPGWVLKKERLAVAQGKDPLRYFDHVELVNAGQSAAATHENRTYVRRILHTLEPRYVRAGFGRGACA
jgi:soluble lytic murein transglycosylase-like protein